MTAQTDLVRRSRLTLILLGVLFFAPFIGAWAIYRFAPDFRPDGSTQHGQLITPARPSPALKLLDESGQPLDETLLRDKWTLLVIGGASCDAACVERLVMLRQVRLALGRNLGRVQRVYIAPDAAARDAVHAELAASHPGLRIVADAGEAGHRAADFFTPDGAAVLHLVDPNGNWLMVYTQPTLAPADLLADLKKLLRLSSIG